MSLSHNYRQDIDGLRAIAVLAVVLYHIGGLNVDGGFVGVDIFFVISGYLISKNIFKQVSRSEFSLIDFYERRFRRLQPALIAVLIVSIVAFSFVLTPIDYKYFGQSIASSMLFCSNILFYIKADYFDPTSETKPLLHTWSLGVEEQFYLIFPLLVLALSRYGRRFMMAAFVLIAVASLAWSILGGKSYPASVFYLPFSRMWELLLGVLLVLFRDKIPESFLARESMALTGLALTLISIFSFEAASGYPGWQALVPCVGAVLIIASAENGLVSTSQLLSIKPLVFIGKLSYSIYLWHWPLLVLVKYTIFRDLNSEEIVAYLALLLLLSWFSWRWIETPVRGGLNYKPWSRNAVFSMTAIAIAVATVFSIHTHFSSGIPQRWSNESQWLASAATDTNPDRLKCDRRSPADIAQEKLCIIGSRSESKPSFAVVGDSFGDALVPGFDIAGQKVGRQGVVLTHSGCFPLMGVHQDDANCFQFTNALRSYFNAHPEIQHVFLVSRWTSAFLGTRFGQIKRDGIFITDKQSITSSYDENRHVFTRSFRRTIEALAGRKISVVAFIPEQQYDVPRALSLVNQIGLDMLVPIGADQHELRQSLIRKVFSEYGLNYPSKIEFIDIGAILCGEEYCAVQKDGVVLYADDNHLSRSGAIYISGQLINSLSAN